MINLRPEEYEHWQYIKRHNETMAQLLTKAAHIPIDDPIVREQKRQRHIVELALVSLASGNTQRTRELLGQL